MATKKYLDGDGVAQVWAAVKQHVADNAVQPDAYSPNLTAGAALSMVGDTVTEATWAQRATDAADGMAVVDAILGRTVVWNQLLPSFGESVYDIGNVSKSFDAATNAITLTSTTDNTATKVMRLHDSYVFVSGHKFYIAATVTTDADYSAIVGLFSSSGTMIAGFTVSAGSSNARLVDIRSASSIAYCGLRLNSYTPSGKSATFKDVIVVDLTAMFGAGNEPSTVAEFEALFPEPYYPYDAGSLLSVNLTGVESVGFNQWDEQWEGGAISVTTGNNTSASDQIRSKNYVPVVPSAEYHMTLGSDGAVWALFYDANKALIPTPTVVGGGVASVNAVALTNRTFTTPSSCHYIRFYLTMTYGVRYKRDVCLNFSDPTRNGEYEPYHHFQRTIPASTYFPNGMRSAGTVHDELTSDAAIVRVGAVDLGTLTWTYNGTKFSTTGIASLVAHPTSGSYAGNLTCALYENASASATDTTDKAISVSAIGNISVHDSVYTDAAAFKAAMDGVALYYALATPTTQAISPALTMTYRVERGGTERVMHTDQTAPPTWRIRYPFDLAGAVMANIAPIENGTASTNYAVGSYLVHDGQLCRVTTAIATGEAITIGTNVTATTVMAEILSLIQ